METIKKLFEMTATPERYSEQEWAELLGSEKVSSEEIDREWQRFREEKLSRNTGNEYRTTSNSRLATIRKIAAGTVIAVVLSGICYAAISQYVSFRSVKGIESQSERIAFTRQKDAFHTAKAVLSQAETTQNRIYENVSLEQIVTDLSHFYGKTPVFKGTSCKALRLYYEWNSTQNIERVLDELNTFEHVNIAMKGDTLFVN